MIHSFEHLARHWATVTLVLCLTLPCRLAGAAVGDLLRTVDLPAAAQCSSGIGTSVTIVPGMTVALDQ